jgi:hypothetical protein
MAFNYREFPAYSAVAGAAGLAATFSLVTGMMPPDPLNGLLVTTMFASPFLCIPAAIGGGIDLFSKNRSGLSKIFSAVAVAAGVAGAGLPLTVHGPEALGVFALTTPLLGIAACANIASHSLRNMRPGYSLKLVKD